MSDDGGMDEGITRASNEVQDFKKNWKQINDFYKQVPNFKAKNGNEFLRKRFIIFEFANMFFKTGRSFLKIPAVWGTTGTFIATYTLFNKMISNHRKKMASMSPDDLVKFNIAYEKTLIKMQMDLVEMNGTFEQSIDLVELTIENQRDIESGSLKNASDWSKSN
jgi:hypothetical protein